MYAPKVFFLEKIDKIMTRMTFMRYQRLLNLTNWSLFFMRLDKLTLPENKLSRNL